MSLNALDFFMQRLHAYSITCDWLLFFRVARGFIMARRIASDGYGRIERLSSGGNEGRERERESAAKLSRSHGRVIEVCVGGDVGPPSMSLYPTVSL